MISRRGFLASLAAAFVTDPERLLWVPGKTLISIPRPKLVTPMLDQINVTTRAFLFDPKLSDIFFVEDLWKTSLLTK